MGVYNPNAPKILGQEWVPIRDEDITFSPAVNVVERGQGFTLTAPTLVQTSHFYVHDPAPGPGFGQTMMTSIYAAGTEDQTGPIKTLVIPCNNGGITGTFSPVINGASFAEALLSPSDASNVTVITNTGTAQQIGMFFATNQYAAQLNGKRILGVNLLYTATGGGMEEAICYLSPNAAFQLQVFQNLEGETPVNTRDISRIRFGEINYFWDPAQNINTGFNVLPWKYADLQRFEASAANRLRVEIQIAAFSAETDAWALNYAALEVIYCEEKRIAVGGRIFYGDFTMGMNSINMYSNQAYTLNPTLPAGDYTVVLSSGDPGDLNQGEAANSTYPELNGLREIYAIPPHPGVQVDIPFPIDDAAGKTFTTQNVHVVPQLSLHTSGGPLTAVQVYGRQARAEVYGTITATQEIFDTGFTAATYPQVRFYARRFGETTVPLKLASTASPTSNVSISPTDFDALDETLDGWKEITLTFSSPPTLGAGTNPQFNWSAAGETSGNRWEVLGAVAPALSGLPSNLLTLAPAPNQLGPATYGMPISGSQVNLGWVPGYAPPVTATTDDPSSDAFLIFSQDMPTVTGMSISVLSQPVTGIGQNCGINPIFIPSEIQYNQISWPTQAALLGYINDTFTRTLTDSWGSTDTGQAYTLTGAAATFDVNGTQGTIQPNVQSALFSAILNSGSPNHEIVFDVSMSSIPISVSAEMDVIVRYTDANNYYYGGIVVAVGGAYSYVFNQVVGGVVTNTVLQSSGFVYTEGTFMTIRVRAEGSLFCFKIWPTLSTEPQDWSFCTNNTALATGNFTGPLARNSNSNLTRVFTYDNLTVTNDSYVFGALELQRMDTVETDWQTIMLATSPLVTGFKDYEARIGILSSYRIRMLNLYDFAGPWSSTVTSTIPAPGVSGSQIVADSHIMTFTTNQVQSGFYNLAYSMAWEDNPITEEFGFPEAGFVTMQSMYNKDFYTAFRPLERGGEEFTRTLLIQAAAISPETLADFTNLRDMAWFNVNYICVRDEDGNRWFATVIVPDGRVRRDRRLYLATVKVIEVTNTPTPVDPS